ncbi:MAG TPA: proline dehydrogenase family protein [Woeseiaceae bacterium]|nr:proline dehydrogenase family protein [Woeseiaceae bacterium]
MSVGLFNRAIAAAMPLVPRPLVWRFSRRYIAGAGLEDAFRTASDLNDEGCTATIDVLGEDSTDMAEVRSAVDLYLQAIRGIHERSLRCGISVKLSELGLRIDVGQCRDAIRSLIASAAEHDRFVRIDMEDSSVTSVTLDTYRAMRQAFDNVGIVIQSCLRRSERDIAELLREGPTDVRLCKGIYIEPEAIAFTDPDEIRSSFNNLLEQLFDGGARRVAIATHDPALVAHAEALIGKMAVGADRYEFQMLLGVAGSLRDDLVARGHPMRVYVPFGDRWYAYSMRRLRENPNIAGHVVSNLLSR